MRLHDLATAIEYETTFASHGPIVKRYPGNDPENGPAEAAVIVNGRGWTREAFYWEFIARPFARSHGAQC